MEKTRLGRLGSRQDHQGKVCLTLRLFLVFCAFVSIAADHDPLAAESGQPKNVLILYSFSERSLFDPLDHLKSAIRSHLNAPVNFYVHYMEAQGLGDPSYERNLSETMRHELDGVKLDLMIVAAYPALGFAVTYRDQISPRVPLLFSYVHGSRLEGGQLWPGVTGVTISVGVRETVQMALGLRAGTQNIAVVSGTSEFERYWLTAARNEIRPYAGKVSLIEIVGLRNDEILKQVATIPAATVVLFQKMPRDSSQPEVGLYDTIAAISQRFPTYCIFTNFCIDHGGVGGSYADYGEQSAKTGEIAARLLAGERPEDIPIAHDSGTHATVDWRQLAHWGIKDANLPSGTIVLYRRPTVWGRYQKYILAGVAVIILQTLLIAGLLWQRARRRKTELTLRESEKRFQVMADTTPSLVWMCDADGKVTYINDRRIGFTGRNPTGGFEDAWTTYIHSDDVESVQTANSEALRTRQFFSKEYRLRRKDGEYRWMLDVASPRRDGTGAFVGFVGSAIDVTDQKLAQKALEDIGYKLIEAQETERRRLARELHDDFSQRLALQCIELTQLEKSLPDSEVEERAMTLKVLAETKELSADMRSLSHQLHPSRLELVGLVSALRGLCEEITKNCDVAVRFTEPEFLPDLTKEIELCFFRIAQEALANVAKHSHASNAQLEIGSNASGVNLHISDSGDGFDPNLKTVDGGIGLISMRERLRQFGGRLSIRTEPLGGTEILAEIPLSTSSKEAGVTTYAGERRGA